MAMAVKKPRTGHLLEIVQGAQAKPLAERGRLMYPEDIVALLGAQTTRHWVNHSFLPSKKIKIGRRNAWWECDVTAALDRGALTE